MAANDTSRAKTYAESDDITIERAKTVIINILGNAESKDEAISSKELAEHVGLKPTTVRDLVKEIKQAGIMPIVACSKGYYQIKTVEQLERELDRIQEEIDTREQSKKDLARAFNRRER